MDDEPNSRSASSSDDTAPDERRFGPNGNTGTFSSPWCTNPSQIPFPFIVPHFSIPSSRELGSTSRELGYCAPDKAKRRKRQTRSSINATTNEGKDIMRMLAELKDQMSQQSMQLTESNSEIRKQMGNLIESQNGQSKEMEKLIESQNGQSKELEKLIESQNGQRKEMEKLIESQNGQSKVLEELTASIRKQLEFHTNITGHAESDAPRSQMNQVPPPRYRLEFRYVPTLKIITGKPIKIIVALVEVSSGRPVENGPLASGTVELVVVNAEFNQNNNRYYWPREDFESNITKPRRGNSATGGVDQSVKSIVSNGQFNLNRGARCYSGSAIFENSQNKKVRLGLMLVLPTGERVLEALSDHLLVRDHVQSGKQSNLHPNSSNGQRSNIIGGQSQLPVRGNSDMLSEPSTSQELHSSFQQYQNPHVLMLAQATYNQNGQALGDNEYQEQNNSMPNMQQPPWSNLAQTGPIRSNIIGGQSQLPVRGNSNMLSTEPSTSQEQHSSIQQYQNPHVLMLAQATYNQNVAGELASELNYPVVDPNFMCDNHDLGHAIDTQFRRIMPLQLVWDRPNVGPIKCDWNLLDQFMPLPKFNNCGLPTKRLMQEHLVYSRNIMSKEVMQVRRNTGVIIEPLEPDDSDEERQLKRKMRRKYQLRFVNKVCEGYHMMDPIKSDDGSLLKVALFNGNRKITNGPLSSASVQIIVLHGDFNDHGLDYWTSEEFNCYEVCPRPGEEASSVLGGDCVLVLFDGEACLGDAFFQMTSYCARTGKFKMGVRLASAQEERIQEGVSEAFWVKDRHCAGECGLGIGPEDDSARINHPSVVQATMAELVTGPVLYTLKNKASSCRYNVMEGMEVDEADGKLKDIDERAAAYGLDGRVATPAATPSSMVRGGTDASLHVGIDEATAHPSSPLTIIPANPFLAGSLPAAMDLAVGTSEATLKSLLSKLGGLLDTEYALIRGVRGDIQFITNELAIMQAFLSNLARACGVDGPTREWMKQVRNVSYDIEDCVDMAHSLRQDPRGDGCLVAIRRSLYEIRTRSARRSVATQILYLKAQAQDIGERRYRYSLGYPKCGKKNGSGGVAEYHAAENQRITRQLVRVQEPVGVRSEDLRKLRDWMDPDRNSKLSVLSIVGFGGVGKTTVALSVFRKYGDQFQRRAMVTVSQNSDPEVVLRNILRQVKPQTADGEHQGEDSTGAVAETKNPAAVVTSLLSRICLQTSDQQNDDGSAWDEKHKGIKADLKKYLQTRYLLLIDDVWSSSTWQTIRRYFPDNENGSRIIVTTRFPAVATTCSADEDTDSIHQVNVLLDDESEKLFHKSVSECNATGDNIPDRVWKMCGGLPLAIVTTAGLVASTQMRTSEEWIKVCNSLFPDSQICRKPEDFMRIINHCYNDLASDLKTCSLYLSTFPNGRQIRRKRLMRRWLAEGFISEKQGLSVEDVADTCFNQLISRKIIRPVQHCSNGRVKSCQVHGMVLEYIISKAAEEDFVTVVGSHWTVPTRSNKVRRLSLHSSDSNRAKEVYTMNLSRVRSLTMFGSLDKLRFKSFKTGIVQVLDLEGCKGFEDVKVICKMFLLKYLNLRRTDIKRLPPNICKLKYLETLDIRETEVQELPKTIEQLERISNLLCGNKNTRKGVQLPKEIKKGTMKTLRVLSGIEIVEGSTSASNLHDFTGLRKLAIYKLHKDKAIFKDLLSCIQYLGGYSLQNLVIDDESSDFFSTLYSMPAPPTYLSALELSGKLLKLPEWVPDLKDLTKLTLSATVLGTDNLVLLSKLRSLFSLTFSVSAAIQGPDMAAILEKNRSDSGGEIFFPDGGFSKLKLLRIFVPLLPSINFSRKATPQLERIELRFKRLEGLRGMEKLETLQDVLLTVDGIGSEPTKSILEDLKRVPSSKCTLIVNDYLD